LLPLRDWPCRSQGWRPSPSRLAGGDAGPGSPTVLPEESRETRVATGPAGSGSAPRSHRFAGAAWDPGPAKVSAGAGTGSGPSPVLPEVGRKPDGNTSSTPRGNSRRCSMTGGGGGGAGRTRWRHHHLEPKGLLVLIPPGDLQTSASPPACRWEVGPDWSEDPHREETRGVGPVTGTAGSERLCGRGGRHHFRLKAEGPL
jgi:hypothetical protein